MFLRQDSQNPKDKITIRTSQHMDLWFPFSSVTPYRLKRKDCTGLNQKVRGNRLSSRQISKPPESQNHNQMWGKTSTQFDSGSNPPNDSGYRSLTSWTTNLCSEWLRFQNSKHGCWRIDKGPKVIRRKGQNFRMYNWFISERSLFVVETRRLFERRVVTGDQLLFTTEKPIPLRDHS